MANQPNKQQEPSQKDANTGAPARPGAPVAPVEPGETGSGDAHSNPATQTPPSTTRNASPPDRNSNPAALGLGGPNPAAGVVQTTIDTDRTTLHPEASIVNPKKLDGSVPPREEAKAVGETKLGVSSSIADGTHEEIQERFRTAMFEHSDRAKEVAQTLREENELEHSQR